MKNTKLEAETIAMDLYLATADTTLLDALASDPDVEERTALRAPAGYHPRHAVPVIVEDGSSPPRAEGSGYYWTTPSGKTVVRYPSAYKWRTLYWPSTRKVVVGREWLAQWRRNGGVFGMVQS